MRCAIRVAEPRVRSYFGEQALGKIAVERGGAGIGRGFAGDPTAMSGTKTRSPAASRTGTRPVTSQRIDPMPRICATPFIESMMAIHGPRTSQTKLDTARAARAGPPRDEREP